MRTRICSKGMGSIFVAGVLAAASVAAVAQEGAVPTTALVNVQVRSHQQFNPASLTLQVDGRNTPIASVQPLEPGQAEIAILIDDGLRRSAALQLNDLATFIQHLPAGQPVLVGYMENGTVRTHGFTTNHAMAAQQLRVPMGVPGESGSPYFCLSDFVKHWPSSQRTPRVVLMISDGVDPYNGSTSILNQDSPYVQAAQEDAQRAGVAVYALYYGDAAIRGGRANFSGQNYLEQVAQATGGESLYLGTFNPPEFTPYLDNFMRDLQQSYLVGFDVNANHERPDTLERIKLKSTQPGVKVYAPDSVHPGNAE